MLLVGPIFLLDYFAQLRQTLLDVVDGEFDVVFAFNVFEQRDQLFINRRAVATVAELVVCFWLRTAG